MAKEGLWFPWYRYLIVSVEDVVLLGKVVSVEEFVFIGLVER